MVEIPDSLRCLFTGSVEERDGRYVVEVPQEEVEAGSIAPEAVYRIGVLPTTGDGSDSPESPAPDETPTGDRGGRGDRPPEPPVEEGEVREVVIESVGDQGDGIAKVDRGYVVIVPGAEPGDEPIIEIDQVQQNVAFANVVESVGDD